MAALQPGVTLELELRSEGGASWCLVPGQEAQHPSGITGGSVGPLTHLIPGQTGLASERGPVSSSFEGTCGGGCRAGSPSLLSQDGSQERCNCSITFHLITGLNSWVGPTPKKGQHTPGLAQQAVHLYQSLSPPTLLPGVKFRPPYSFPPDNPCEEEVSSERVGLSLECLGCGSTWKAGGRWETEDSAGVSLNAQVA